VKQVLFIHGGGGGAYEADAALAESLRRALGPNYHVRYPEMPDEEEPDYDIWKRDILQNVQEMGEGAILVGHSIGASVLCKMLTDGSPADFIAGAFLISGPFWYDHEFWRWDEAALSADASERYPRDIPLFLYHGEADEFVPFAHLAMYAKALPNAVVGRSRAATTKSTTT
jgi:uncharacterized protein